MDLRSLVGSHHVIAPPVRYGLDVGYHVTGQNYRESIERHGLDHTKSGRKAAGLYGLSFYPPGNYVFDTLADAEMAASISAGWPSSAVPIDIWKVDLSGLILLPDLANWTVQENREWAGIEGFTWFSPDPIPPDRLERIASHEPEQWC